MRKRRMFRKILTFITLTVFIFTDIFLALGEVFPLTNINTHGTLSPYTTFILQKYEDPDIYEGALVSNKHFMFVVMSIAKYLFSENGDPKVMSKWLRHSLPGDYMRWVDLIDYEKVEKSLNQFSFQMNFRQKKYITAVSLKRGIGLSGGSFNIEVKEINPATEEDHGVKLPLKRRKDIIKIGFSVLSSDDRRIREEVIQVMDAGVDSIHVDHLDGKFTPGLSSFDCTGQIKKIADLNVELNVHLMVEEPGRELINKLIDSGMKKHRDSILLHFESYEDPARLAESIRYIDSLGYKTGLVINPETGIDAISGVIIDIGACLDSVMVMSIIPGAGSRPFIDGTTTKVKEIKSQLEILGLLNKITVIVDGGLNEVSLSSIIDSDVDALVTRTWLLNNTRTYSECVIYIKELSRQHNESVWLNSLMEHWGILNYQFVIDAIVRFCSGDTTFTREEITSTIKRLYGVSEVLVSDDRIIDIYYPDKLIRFHKEGVIPIEHLGLRDRTYYDGIVVKVYTGNVANKTKGKYILGISGSWHDATAVLVKDGKLIAALEEERMTRVKHDGSLFPVNAIFRLMEDEGITWDNIKHVSLGWNYNLYVDTPHSRNPNEVFFRNMDETYAMGKGISPESVIRRNSAEKNKSRFDADKIYAFLDEMAEKFGTSYEPRVSFVGHSRAHAASAYYTCGFEGKVLTVVVDGYGDFESGSVWLCEDGSMKELARFQLPHSLGWMWAAITEYLGFKPASDEGQIMGFAPYGEPWDSEEMQRVNALREIFKDYIRFDKDKEKLIADPENYYYGKMLDGHIRITESFQTKMAELGITPYDSPGKDIDPNDPEHRPYANLAFVLQERTSQVFCDIVRYYFRERPLTKGTDKLALAGGVALNILSNGKLITEGLVYGENIFVQPAAGDSGLSIGAALTVSRDLYGYSVNNEMESALYGPEYSDPEIRKILDNYGLKEGSDYFRVTETELIDKAALLIKEAKAIGWFQGRSEIGPRALGARSILLNLNDNLANNTANIIKGRQPWRPSASSILEEHAKDFFMGIGKSPFMVLAFSVLFRKQSYVQSGLHQFGDKLARPQTVSKSTNRLYWELLEKVGELTGTPAVVNTSFNKKEPLVENPEEALNTFYYMEQVENLFIGNYFVKKTGELKPKIISLEDEKFLNRLIKEARVSGDVNKWMKIFDIISEVMYKDCHKINIIMEDGKNRVKKIKIPLVKEMFSGGLQEPVVKAVSAIVYNHAIAHSAEKIRIRCTFKKMERTAGELIKENLVRSYPRMKYFSAFGKDLEIGIGSDRTREGKRTKEISLYADKVRPEEMSGDYLGIDVGGTGIKGVLLRDNVVLKSKEIQTTFLGGRDLGQKVRALVKELSDDMRVEGIGVSLPGVVDLMNKKIVWLAEYELEWRKRRQDVRIEYGQLEEQLRLMTEDSASGKITIMNDGTAFGISNLNSLKAEEDSIVVVLGRGLGTARIEGGKINISRIEQSGVFVVDLRDDAGYDEGCEIKGAVHGGMKDGKGKLIPPRNMAESLVKWFRMMHAINGDSNFLLTGGAVAEEYGREINKEILRIVDGEENRLPIKVTWLPIDRKFGGAVGSAQLAMKLAINNDMESIHEINLSMVGPGSSRVKVKNLIAEDLVPLYIRNKFRTFLSELYRKYPFVKEKEEIILVGRDLLERKIQSIIEEEGPDITINAALSSVEDISKLPSGVKAAVFSGPDPGKNYFAHLEGIVAVLRALQQKDAEKLVRLFEYLSGEKYGTGDTSYLDIINSIEDPAALAKLLIFELKPVEVLVNRIGLTDKLLRFIEESA